MNFRSKQLKRSNFSLFELIIVVGVLALFLYMCSNTLIFTLQTKELLQNNYSEERVKSIGWTIFHVDLSNAVGKFYLEGTVPVAPPPQKKGDKKTSEQKKTKPKAAPNVPRLFVFNSEADIEEAFLEVVVSRGRVKRSAESNGAVHSFKLVKYYLMDHPEGEGQVIMRTEEAWKKENKSNDNDDKEFDLEEDFRRFTILEDYTDFEFKVYNGKEWVEEWNSASNQDLPLALKVTCTKIAQDEDGNNQIVEDDDEVERIIPIPLSYLPVQKPEEEI